jgi:phage terminase large subunit GpA-like protein
VITQTTEQRSDQLDFLRQKLRAIPSRNSSLRIDEYAEQNRIMPVGNPRPGPWSNDYTPYLIETMRNMSPDSPIQREIVMKGAQGGWTALAENMICYYMDEMPADILFVSATGELLERWASRRLEPAIDSCGIRSKITKSGSAKLEKSRKTGDRTFSKEYSGCRLDMASARSSPALSATDKRILIRDEVDRAPTLLSTGEGNWMKVSYARTNFWSARRKVYDLGTPTLDGESQIDEAYKIGDKRKFLIPCPRCGAFQELKFGSEDTQYGLKPDTKAGELLDAYYLCEHCHDAFFNNEKYQFLPLGYWEPTRKSDDRTVVSRHWPSFYAPIGALSWKEIYQRYQEALDDPLGGMQTFVNLYLGIPYRPEGTKPKIPQIPRGSYKKGTVPDGVLYLTAGVDVQLGKKKDKNKPARLEMEICGHGIDYRTWSIDYKVIKGAVTDPYDGAWHKLRQMFLKGELIFKREDGIPLEIKLILVDSEPLHDVVFQFCLSGMRQTFPSKGFKFLSQRKDELTDEMTTSDLMRYRWVKSGEFGLYSIATVFYKRIVYGTLNIPRQPVGSQKKGFCEFPSDYPKSYFQQLTAEEMREGGRSFHNPGNRANEALDIRVMNLAAGHIWLDEQVRLRREHYRKVNGWTKERAKVEINSLFILRSLEAKLNARIQQVRKELGG